MKTSKRIISFVLCALMVASCFFCTGKLPELEAKAATVGDFSQTRVVSNYESLYRTYQKRFFGGEETNWPTNFVIPGLSEGQDYTPQGMTYWAEKEWILISAYDASGSGKNSVIYALDVVTTNLVAVFKIQNADGSVNTSHGGGIAASKYNFYYADSDSKVSYIPLSEMDVTSGVHTIKLKDSVDFSTELTGSAVGNTTPVKTSYCCYDDGVLWTGNFYYAKDSSYSQDFMNSVGYPSVLMGYKLVGNSSDEEWNHLKTGSGAPSTAEHKGCAGDPTYVIGLNFDKIQYAMVDKGKVYVSRSWKRTWSDNHTRDLVIGEIDLNVPGTTQAQIAGSNRYVHLINYEDCIHFGGDNGGSSEQLNKMFYMGEALCVIDDYLYMFGEGAAWNYNGKDSSNVCPEPIDVIWKIDQYAIQGLTRPHEDVAAVEYEKVYSLSELNSTDEYIVLHESPIKDSVTQDNILYLLDSFGGYGDKRLPKKATSGDINDASTGDSRGIVGYEIRDYSVKIDEQTGKESLILNAEDDANKSLQWKFESGSSSNLVLSNRELYYAKHPYLYSGDTFFAMTTAADPNMQIECDNNGNFKIKGNKAVNGGYYIWCNDGSDAGKITAYTNFYSNHGKTGYIPNYNGLTEQAGTFHAQNASHPANGSAEQQIFHIYKRVSDPYASSYETQVYTDLSAKLTSDGTYDITLETYATNNLQYQRVAERPTDFIFVLDSSGSLDETDSNAYKTDSSWSALQIGQIVSSDKTAKGVTSYDNNDGDEKFFYQTSDGAYHPIYASVKTFGNYDQYYYVYYVNIYDGLRYSLKHDGSVSTTGWTYDELVTNMNNKTNASGNASNSTNTNRRKCEVWGGKYYTYSSGHQRLDGIKNAVDSLTYKIAEQASASGLDHRIAICSFGTDGSTVNGYQWEGTNLYTNSGSKISYPNITDANYQNAFFSVSQFGTLRSVIAGMSPLGHTYPSYGLDMASNIIDQQKNLGNTYDVNGNRSAVVIVISDGVPGWEEDDDRDLNVTKQVANDTLANGAYSLKRNGAYIYSVLLGSDSHFSETDFDERDFMKYLSSEYTGSVSLTNPGPHNTKEGVDYYKQIPNGSDFNLYDITDEVFSNVVANSTNAISSLTAEAILREHLTDAFDISNASIKYETAKSKYDGIGRLYFEAPVTASGISGTLTDDNEISITGFDYSANNVSEYNSNLGNGKKLIVTISGVIANADAELLNTSINDTEFTAIYENNTYKTKNQPVKKFPNYHFSIPEYTYYMDYDIPMYDSDINGTLCSVDSTLQKQSTYKTSLSTSNMGIQFVNGNQDMVYTLNSQGGLTEQLSKGYVLIKRDDGTYDWFRLNIVPASTVYYEENKMEPLDGTNGYKAWTSTGSYDGKYQSLSTDSDIFGNDYTYSSSTDSFSLGTNKSVTVTSSEKRSNTQTFTFTGTGFDLVSACGSDTGIQTVVVRDANGELVQTYIVDTYYNDTTYGTITQVPIVQFKGAYGTYNVQITAAYYSFAGALKTQSVDVNALGDTGIDAYTATAEMSVTDKFFAEIGMDELIGQEVELIWMDKDSVLNGGMGATETTVSTQAGESTSTTTPATSLVNYIDGFRIYNPVDYNDEYINNEKDASYYSVIEAITAGGIGGDSLAAYIEPGATGEITFGNYLTSGGPKYEVYLEPDDSIAFRFKANYASGSLPQAMVSVRAASTKNGNPKVKFGVTDATATSEFEVKSASETFYNVTNLLGVGGELLPTSGTFTLTVTNTGSGLLAVDNIKFTNAELVPINDVSLAELEAIISTQAVEIDPYEVKSAPATFVEAPADDPNVDPEGRIPTLEEYIAIHGSGNNGDDHSGADSFADKIIAFVEKLIDIIKKVIALIASTVTSIF